MQAKFYNCKRDERYVYKIRGADQTNTEPVDVEILTPANNVVRPQIRLSTGRLGNKTNYVWLEDLMRFYYIRSWTMENGYITMDLEVDVLMSFRHSLMDCKAMIKRNEFSQNAYIRDEKVKILEPTRLKIATWDSPFDKNGNYFYLALVSNTGADNTLGGENDGSSKG